jgi:hypothetical protein
MIVWIWDASGPDQAGAGVTDSEASARLSAEAFMRKAQAPAARIEKATLDIAHALTAGYLPTGYGWSGARADDGAITWTRLLYQLAAS